MTPAERIAQIREGLDAGRFEVHPHRPLADLECRKSDASRREVGAILDDWASVLGRHTSADPADVVKDLRRVGLDLVRHDP